MKLGLICRSDNGGLGNQTWELYRHLKPFRTLLVDISSLNQGRGQHGYDTHNERYTDGEILHSVNFPTNDIIDQFLDGLDIIFTVETPYSYYLYEAARARGVKTIQQYNYEFIDYFVHPEWPKPDMLLAPSKWHYEDIQAKASEWGCRVDYLPVPVNRSLFPYKQKTQIKKFLHIAGHSTYEDRNGTQIVLDAIPLVKADVEFILRGQYALPPFFDDYRVKVMVGDAANYWELHDNEDALLLPRRYGGLSLQLSEAMSSGMIPIMTDIPPQNEFLHPTSLIPAEQYMHIAPRTPIDCYRITPQQLADKIDWMASLDEKEVKALSEFSAQAVIGWDEAIPMYEKLLWDLLNQ